jgi:NTE family protein
MTTAFVLSGGASLGAVQVGMLRALVERGVAPDLLVGTSAGALNAAFVAGHGPTLAGVDALAEVWRGIRGRSMFPLDPIRAVRSLLGRGSALCSNRGLRDLLDEHLLFERLEDSPIPLTLVASDLFSGRELALSQGSARQAVLASSALPAAFPPVRFGDRLLVDGCLANDTAISVAVDAGASSVYVLPSGYSCALPEPPRSPVAAAVHALAVLTHQRMAADVALYADAVDLVVLPPPCPIRISGMNFEHADELMAEAYACATAALDVDAGRRDRPELAIGVHEHRDGTTSEPSR